MSKTSIKIIKRKEAETAAASNDETQNFRNSKSAAVSREKIERRLHRKMAETVSKWITERGKNARAEEVSAFRKLFGEEFLSGRTA